MGETLTQWRDIQELKATVLEEAKDHMWNKLANTRRLPRAAGRDSELSESLATKTSEQQGPVGHHPFGRSFTREMVLSQIAHCADKK